ncbi:MAG: energy transducer TonB [candidate division WOR-3 bacterium]
MKTKLTSLTLTILTYSTLILLLSVITFKLKPLGGEILTLGFETEEIEEREVNREVGGAEDVFSSIGDLPIIENKPKKGLSPLLKPPYKEGEIEEKGKSSGYRISGELSKRKLIHFENPKYPKDENENTEVKLEIEVTPEGKIKSIKVIKTGGLSFDKSAIEAVQEWEFQPLSPTLPQENQKGIVTIYFEIR